MTGLSNPVRRRILGQNAIELFRLPNAKAAAPVSTKVNT
jgi:hypothetical protein